MKVRIITGLVGSALALVVLLLLPPIFLNIAMAAVCGLAMYEILIVTKFVGHRGLVAAALLFSIASPFLLMGGQMVTLLGILAYCVALIFIQIIYHDSLKIERTGFVFFVSVLVSVSFSCLAYLRPLSGRGDDRDGLFYVFLAIIMAWLCDIGAYFIGTFFGKHKLCPKISPKKTVEGLIGGLVVSVVCSVLAAWLYQICLNAMGIAAHVSLWQVALLSLICAPLSVMGDLFASIIKRQCQVKDFGHIMPGHGGVMDRFDSLMFVAPLTFIAVQYWPLIYTMG